MNTVEGAQQLLPTGPVASQEAIKMLGTNGGRLLSCQTRRIRSKTQPHAHGSCRCWRLLDPNGAVLCLW
ncbi:potassium-transporting ATPase subunit KdpA [Shigella flexneri]